MLAATFAGTAAGLLGVLSVTGRLVLTATGMLLRATAACGRAPPFGGRRFRAARVSPYRSLRRLRRLGGGVRRRDGDPDSGGQGQAAAGSVGGFKRAGGVGGRGLQSVGGNVP